MLTREEIINHLNHDPTWTPDPEASQAEWDLFEDIATELEDKDLGDNQLEDLAEPWEGLEEDDLEADIKDKDEDW